MRKINIVILLLIIAIGGISYNFRAENLPVSIPNKIVQSTVYIEVESVYGETWSGSGVIIQENGLILTAGHVVHNAKHIKITLFDGSVYDTGHYYCKDYPGADVGFIKVDAEKLPILLVKNIELTYGDTVYCCGCPFGKDLAFTLTKGIVAGFDRDIEELSKKNLLQIDAQSWPGNSGGPVCNDKGEVIGVLIGGLGGCDGISLYTTAEICLIELDKYNLDMKFGSIK